MRLKILIPLILIIFLFGSILVLSDKNEYDIISSNGTILETSDSSEIGCINSGGKISTQMCCKSGGDFPITFNVSGPCGCAPEHSHLVKICLCGNNMHFDGEKCVNNEIDN